jgi:phosphotriesterase-related protein
MGRDLRSLAWLARTTETNIIAGCGYYIKSSHPSDFSSRTAASFADEMVRDLSGENPDNIRAGVIGELGISSFPMDQVERRILEAAAEAQRQTNAAIIAHSAPGPDSPFEISDTLEDAGADMTRVVISHLDERFRFNVDKYVDLANRGVGLGLDTFGREVYLKSRNRQHPSDESRIEIVLRLLDAGMAQQLLLSQDICLKHELSMFGGHGYSHLLRNVLPRMINSGVPQSMVDMMSLGNAARILCS